MLAQRKWRLKYTREDGDLVSLFYLPALEDAERYDRLTGYFDAGALALAARGVEALARNRSLMRLIAGCTLAPPEIDAIRRGADLRALVEKRLAEAPLAPRDTETGNALELLAWMVARGHLEAKVAVPLDADGNPAPDSALFHEKTGIVADRAGDRLAWTGSLNETAAGWRKNWESIAVYTSWGPEPGRVDAEERNFAALWADRAGRARVLDVPEAARRDLMRFMPAGGSPARLKPPKAPPRAPAPAPTPSPAPPPARDRRSRVWAFIRDAARLEPGGARVGEATAPVAPWPHQVRAFERLYGDWPPRLLIADEVGLGKTVQAGMLLRQAWLAGKAKRILILAPKAVLRQWRVELREKFNLDRPIYDGRALVHEPAPAAPDGRQRPADRRFWRDEPAVIASSQLMRRADRAADLLAEEEPWDLVVLDEAHHARRRAPGSAGEGRPNALLRLMRGLKTRARGLVLLTATPMQVHPIEVHDLLDLLGLPPEWTESAFLRFFEDLAAPNPGAGALSRIARLFRAAEREHGEIPRAEARRVAGLPPPRTGKVLRALRDRAEIPRRQLETAERRAALAIARAHAPLRLRVSRHTRETLRGYFRSGAMTVPIAERRVEDRFVAMTPAERALYEAVEDHVATTWRRAAEAERAAVGFAMTIYRRRLASSFRALRATLEKRLAALDAGAPARFADDEEDAPDDDTDDDAPDFAELGRRALAAEERAGIETLLARVRALPPDSKLARLRETLDSLRRGGHDRAMVFTQYTDTMDFLRDAFRGGGWRPLCFSGRGGEIPDAGGWRRISRGDAGRRFRDGGADLMICTDAAAEGLNFQFCGALIDYDMPWNPMRVEQRIGRIDRLGQRHSEIRVVNLHYEGTVETDVYRALRERIGLFESVVGRMQPVLARLPGAIAEAVLTGGGGLADDIRRRAGEAEADGFDIDSLLGESVADMRGRPPPALDMADLDRVLSSPDLMPPGVRVQPLGNREYGLLAPGMTEPRRVTTDPARFGEHPESLEFWSPGNPLFRPPDIVAPTPPPPPGATLRDILEE